MTNIFILTLAIGFFILMFLLAPIMIGVFVYKHASKHPIGNPIMWALTAALVPFYIGLMVYVVKIDQIDTERYDREHS